MEAKPSRGKEALWGRRKGILRNPLYLLPSSHVKYLQKAMPVVCLHSVIVHVCRNLFGSAGAT